MRIELYLTFKNFLSVITLICVVALTVVPLKYSNELSWLRWQIAIPVMAVSAVIAVIWQAFIQSRQDQERDVRDMKLDTNLSEMKHMMFELKVGTPVAAVSQSTEPVGSLLAKADTDIAAKFVRAYLVNRHPFASFIGDVYRAANREYLVESDFLFEVHLVNKADVSTTIQKMTCEAEINGAWVSLLQLDSLSDYQLEFKDRVEDSPSWIGGQHKKVEDLLPDLAERLKGTILAKGVGYQGWLRFGLNLGPNEPSPVTHRLSFTDALDVSHPVRIVDPLLTDGNIIHNPKVWRERLRN